MNDITIDRTDLGLSISSTLSQMKAIKITTPVEYEKASEFLKKTKVSAKMVETSYEEEYTQKYKAYKDLLAEKKYYIDMLAEAELIVKNMMKAYNKKIEDEQALERRKQMEIEAAERIAAEASGAIVISEITTPVQVVEKQKISGVSGVKVWRYEIENVDMLPRDYLMADEKKIGAIVRAAGETIKIPGVKIWSENDLRVRA